MPEKIFVDYPTNLYKRDNLRILRLLLATTANRVKMDSGDNVENSIANVQNNIKSVNVTANSAVNKADAAQETADKATIMAGVAQHTANEAQTSADTAQTLATSAKKAAETAQSSANSAQTTADNAQSAAIAAKAQADKGISDAAAAQSTANAAKALCVDMKGATTTAAGVHGFVPAPAAGTANRYLRSDGSWQVPPDTNTTYGNATQSTPGLMSTDDKKKLDGIAAGATNTAAPPAAATAAPKAHGTAAVGTSAKYAREDHVHPSNNTDTHWTTHLYAGASNGNANAATTNGNTYLIACDNTAARDRRLIKGTGATTVTSDANGNITINSTNTTYGAVTQSANGLMTAADKKKVDGLNDSNMVHKSGDESIAGAKTFTDKVFIRNSGTDERMGFILPGYNQGNGSIPKSDQPNNIRFFSNDNWKLMGMVEANHASSGYADMSLIAYGTKTDGSLVNNYISVSVNRTTGRAHMYLDSGTPLDAANKEVAVASWVRNLLAGTASVSAMSLSIPTSVTKRVSLNSPEAQEALNSGITMTSLDNEETPPCEGWTVCEGQDFTGEYNGEQFIRVQRPLTDAEKFELLRTERNIRLLAYDSATSRLSRQLRKTNSDAEKDAITSKLAAWDAYAEELCALPDQNGAPWDGGGKDTPWPDAPDV